MTEYELLTKEIKQRESNIVLGFVDIGRALLKLREKSLYKANYGCFEAYVDNEFSFGHAQAFKFIKIAQAYPLLESDSKVTKELGITKLYLLSFVPELERKEIFEEIKETPRVSVKELKNKIKRFDSTQVECHSKVTKEDSFLKLQRQGYLILDEVKELKSAYNLIKCKTKDWYDETEKYEKLDFLRDQIVKEFQNI